VPNINYSTFYCYGFHFTYACPFVFHAAGICTALYSGKSQCYCIIFHSIVKGKFLEYVFNITHRFVVMHVISYRNVVYLIMWVYNCCLVFFFFQYLMDSTYLKYYALGCMSQHKEWGRKLFTFFRNPVRYIHNIIE
jgi:hypothetical protein